MNECSPCDLEAIVPIDPLPGGTPQLQCPTCGRVDTIDNWTNLVAANLRTRQERARVKKDKTRARAVAEIKAQALEEFAAAWLPTAEATVRKALATEPHEILETVALAIHDHAQELRSEHE